MSPQGAGARRPTQEETQLNGVAKASTERVAGLVEWAGKGGLPPMYAAAELVQAAVLVLRGAGYEFDGIPNFVRGCAGVACKAIEEEHTRLQGQTLTNKGGNRPRALKR